MNRRHMTVGIVLIFIGLGAIGVVHGLGPSWMEQTRDSTPSTAGPSTSTPVSNHTPAAETPTEPPPFVLHIDSIESCGQTCRDVTATLVNTQDRRSIGVVVSTTIHAGESVDGSVVWEGEHQVGSLPAGESVQHTSRIELGFMSAAAVQGAGGEITIVTSVESNQQSVRFVRHRDVT